MFHLISCAKHLISGLALSRLITGILPVVYFLFGNWRLL